MEALPQQFIGKLQKLLQPNQLEVVFSALSEPSIPSFRVNTIKADVEETLVQLSQLGFQIAPVVWNKHAFSLRNKSIRELTETSLVTEGKIYIQNLSSMLPARILDPQPTDIVLDIAAAPGSKTTQMAALMKNQGLIVANDISRQRLYKLQYNLEQQGVTNTKIVIMPGQDLWQRYPEYFDRTLVDAPCSMEGRFQINNPKTYEGWTQRKVKELAVRQQHLIRSAISATKPGGVIVYSTCTISPEENEGVIDWILKKEGDAIEIESITIESVPFTSGITHWNKDYDPRVAHTARIYPSRTMEGFFVTKIKKLHSTV